MMPVQFLDRATNLSLPVRQERKREDSRKTSCGKRQGAFAGMFMLVCSCLLTLWLVGKNKSRGECTRQNSENFFLATQTENLNSANKTYRFATLNAKCDNIFMLNLQVRPNAKDKLNRAGRIRRALATKVKVRTAFVAKEIL